MGKDMNESLDQAEKLRREMHKSEKEKYSSLPSRSEVHRKKRTKNKWRIKFPLLKLLALFFILLPVSIYSVYQNYGEKKHSSKDSSGNGYDMVEVTKKNAIIPQSAANEENKVDSNSKKQNKQKIQSDYSQEDQSVSSPNSSSQPSDTSTKTESNSQKETEATSDGYQIIYHTVKSQETLFSIAMKYYNSQEGIQLIKDWNGMVNNEIETGQVLKIPIKQ